MDVHTHTTTTTTTTITTIYHTIAMQGEVYFRCIEYIAIAVGSPLVVPSSYFIDLPP